MEVDNDMKNPRDEKQPLNIVLLGPPTSGKGTQAQMISKKYGLVHISSGDVLREIKEEQSRLGEFVRTNWSVAGLNDLTLELIGNKVKSAIETANGFVLDGTPKTIDALYELDRILSSVNSRITLAIDINVSFEDLVKRVTGRRVHIASGRVYHIVNNPPKVPDVDDVTGEPLVQREDDTEPALKTRYSSYEKLTLPVHRKLKEEGILFTVNGAQEIDKVFEEIDKIIQDNINREIPNRKKRKMIPKYLDNHIETVATPISAVTSAFMQQDIIKMVESKKTFFPGKLPVSLTRDNVWKITKKPYMVAPKVDGVRYFLYLNEGSGYLINRKMQIFCCNNLKVDAKYNSTLLDGELTTLLSTPSTCAFVVFDALQVSGNSVRPLPLSDRLNAADEIVKVLNEAMQKNRSLSFMLLQYYEARNINSMTHTKLPFPVDGFVFVPTKCEYRLGYHQDFLKWKERNRHTADFVLKVVKVSGKEVFELFSDEDFYTWLGEENDSVKCQLMELGDTVIECYWDETATTIAYVKGGVQKRRGGWKYVRSRPDKQRANLRFAIKEVEKAIDTGISRNELMSQLSGDRSDRYRPPQRRY